MFKSKLNNPKSKKEKSDYTMPHYCPDCKAELKSWSVYCPTCKSYVPRDAFSLAQFLKDNYQLFALIGILGTLTALLPTISEKYFKLSDLTAIPFPQSIFLFSSLIFNSLMIIWLLMLVFFESVTNRKKEVFIIKIFNVGIVRKGDPGRFVLIFAFLFPLGITAVYLYNIFPILGSIIGFAFVLAMFAGIYFLLSGTQRDSIILRNLFLVFAIVLFVLLVIWIYSAICIFAPRPTPNVDVSNIFIESDVNYYTPNIADSVGIGLIPTNCSNRNCSSIKFYWTTNYGYFINWEDGSTRVRNLGNCTYHNSNTVYWTYGMSDIGKEKPPVNISLIITDSQEDHVLVSRTMNLTWIDVDVLACNADKKLGTY